VSAPADILDSESDLTAAIEFARITPGRIVKLWSVVDRSGGPQVCWPWTGCRNEHGYGRIAIGSDKQWRSFLVPRVVLFLTTGEVGAVAMHSCDNPPCCNPQHLAWGTQGQNLIDSYAKGRKLRGLVVGERHGMSKLRAADITEIRRRLAAGDRVGEIASAFNVHRASIANVRDGRTWRSQ